MVSDRRYGRYWSVILALGWLTLGSQAPCAERVASPSPPKKEERGNTANGGENIPLPFPVTVVETPKQATADERAKSESREHESRDLDAQIRTADAAEKQIPLAWFGAILAFAGTVLLYINLREARKATKAARDAADSAEKTLHATRAWLLMDTVDSPMGFTGELQGKPVKDGLIVRMWWRNTGQSPALRVLAVSCINHVGPNDPLPHFAAPHNPDYATPVGVGKLFSTTVAMDDQVASMFRQRTARTFVYSKVSYFDIFEKKERVSEFCAEISYDGEFRDQNTGHTGINMGVKPIGPQNTAT